MFYGVFVDYLCLFCGFVGVLVGWFVWLFLVFLDVLGCFELFDCILGMGFYFSTYQ